MFFGQPQFLNLLLGVWSKIPGESSFRVLSKTLGSKKQWDDQIVRKKKECSQLNAKKKTTLSLKCIKNNGFN